MYAERISDLARRAAVHAALADPARLLITDTLLTGDASPSELAAMLPMPSNLLAHHLHVLRQAGVIARRRSEGDRRRTYLRLVPGALDSLAAPPGLAARRVLFVCTANSARSHLAAALWRRASAVPAASAGTHPAAAIDPSAIAAARRHRLPLPRLRPRHLDDVQQDDDLIITVCDLAREELGRQAAVHWSVPEPGPGWRSRQLRRGRSRAQRPRSSVSRRAWPRPAETGVAPGPLNAPGLLCVLVVDGPTPARRPRAVQAGIRRRTVEMTDGHQRQQRPLRAAAGSQERPVVPTGALRRTSRLAMLPLRHAARTAAAASRLSRAATDQVAARTAEQVFATLGELKGGAAKLGQAMSVFEAAMPEEVAAPIGPRCGGSRTRRRPCLPRSPPRGRR